MNMFAMTRTIRARCTTAATATLMLIGPPCTAQDLAMYDALEPAELGTLVDMVMVTAALDMQVEHTGPPERLDESWVSLADLIPELDPAVIQNLPWSDRWGNRLLVSRIDRHIAVWSSGPDGILEDPDIAKHRVSARSSKSAAPLTVGNDDVVMIDGDVVIGPMTARERFRRTMADLRTVVVACEAFAVDHHRYPDAPAGVVTVDTLQSQLSPVYIRRIPVLDAWGNPFRVVSTSTSLIVISAGADGVLDLDYGTVDSTSTGWTRPDCVDAAVDLVYFNGDFVSYPAGLIE